MKEYLTILAEIIIFAYLIRYTMITGVVNGMWALLIVPFLVNAAADTVAGWAHVLRDGGGRRDG